MKSSQSLTKRLSLYVIGATVLLFLIMSIFEGLISLILIKDQVDETAAATLKTVVKEVEDNILTIQTATKNLANLVSLNLDDPPQIEASISRLLNFNEMIIGSTAAFVPGKCPAGKVLYAPYLYKDHNTDEIISINFAEDDSYFYTSKDWFTIPRDSGKASWSEPYFDEGGGSQLMTTYSLPLKDYHGEVVSVLTADVSLDSITESLAVLHPNEHSKIFILSQEGKFLTDESYSGLLKASAFDIADTLDNKDLFNVATKMIQGESGSHQFKKLDGAKSLAIYGPLSNGWSVLIVCPYEDFYSQIDKFSWFFTLLTLLGLVVVYLIDRRVINSATMPVTEFAYSAMNIAKGNFNASIPTVNTQDELKKLENSLNYLEHSVKSYIRELRTTTESKEKIESELQIASHIQNQMLPSVFPAREDLELSAILKPAKEVGGDLYDFIEIGDKLYFIVGDVSGKGVSAALYMSMVSAAFRFLSRMNLHLSDFVSYINNSIADRNEGNMFVTLFVGRIDIKTQELEYCNAGHNPIIVIGPDGTANYLKAKPNLAAGLFPDFAYVEEKMKLKPGSRLFAYTDGVSEAENTVKELFGEERLLDYFRNAAGVRSEKELLDGLFAELKTFTAGNSQNDDITMMSIHLRNDMTKRFDPIKDKSSDIIEYLMSSPFIPDDESLKFKMRLSIEEAVENVVRYAYEDGIGWLEASIGIDDAGLELTVVLKDAGVPFNPLDKEDPDLTLSAEERSIGGLGIFLCKQLMDSIDYKYEKGCNCLTMRKKCS